MTREKAQKEVQQSANDAGSVRAPDPNVQQGKALRPESSVWVTASAGTGKTKVLTDRVLRLLLPREDGQPGTEPDRILCLTFTKAGAGEMSLRLAQILASWAVIDGTELQNQLQSLLRRAPGKTEIEAARQLFAAVADTPGGLKIMTIHSFCQSVLGRFPLEAGIAPHFTPLEEIDAHGLLEQARDSALRDALAGNSDLRAAIRRVAAAVNEEQFFGLVQSMAKEREQLDNLLAKNFGTDGFYEKLCADFSVPPGKEPEDILRDACTAGTFDEPALRSACKALSQSRGKKEPEWASLMQTWLDSDVAERISGFDSWRDVFVKPSDGLIREKDFPTAAVGSGSPDIIPVLRAESERVLQIADNMNAAACAMLTRDLFVLGADIIARYQTLKRERAALDFDDLIFTTCALLEGRAEKMQGDNAAAWVLFKLDRGIDHILVDEAQDTNPEQWRIVKALADEFSAGFGARDVERTIFVVGDEKQSIYSFQRASPRHFADTHEYLRKKIRAAKKEWDDVPLQISFRSTKSVLQAVDAVFEPPNMLQGVSAAKVEHESYRLGQAGMVELWPLSVTPPKDVFDHWAPPVEIRDSTTGAAQLAKKIAETIDGWIKNKEQLPARGRAIRPGDLMILLPSRNAFFRQVAKALKDKKIPVSGTDRMILNDQIAVQDVLALAKFALQPLDDLNLACALKSPFAGMDDDSLFVLAHGREKKPLWLRVQEVAPEAVRDYLREVQSKAALSGPFDFLSWILQSPCPADERSGLRALQKRLGRDILDPLDELLNAAINDESNHTPSLQNFLHRFSHGETEIRREMDDKGGVVRIMTVHGAKGLQAPIVILPDTVRTRRGAASKAESRLLWPDKTGLELPLWSPRKELSFNAYDAAQTLIHQREDEEYRRLLYVAMTRAEDRLYLAGYTGTQRSNLESWYPMLKNGLESIAEIETLDDGSLRLENRQIPGRAPDRPDPQKEAARAVPAAPAWLIKPAPEEKMPDAPLRASKMEEPALHSPRQPDNPYRFRRGNLTHKLLEFLPPVDADKRAAKAKDFLNRFAPDLPGDVRESIAGETLKVLNDPQFAAVFGTGSLAEVPLTGRLKDGRIVNGQIDRLLITDKEILIVDYKTNRPPPQNEADVPPVYTAQMRAYRDLLSAIYPGRTVSCALLWTDGARLMRLNT